MKPVKTHTFKLGTYKISLCGSISGVTDIPDDDSGPEMLLVDGDTLDSLDNIFHEGCHAQGIPSKYLHDANGCSTTKPIARLVWRLGWRKK